MAKRKDDGKAKTIAKPQKAKTSRRSASSRAGKAGPPKRATPTGVLVPAPPASELVERDLAERAVEKQRSGKAPTAQELGALRRVEKQRGEALRAEHYRTIPQRDWVAWSGRQRRTLVDQAQKYGLPIGGATIDLAELAKGLHDFLAANAGKLSADAAGNGTLQEQKDAVALETKSLQNERARMELQKQQGLLITRKQAHEDRLEIVTLFVGVLEVAGSELSSKLAGLKPAETRRKVEGYFDGKRQEIAGRAERQG